MSDFIPVNRPLIEDEDIEAISKTLSEGWISSEAKVVEDFEAGFSSLCKRRYGVAVTNGTVALEISLSALNLKPQDEVIIPSFSIVSCLAAVIRSGATPILVDSDDLTWNMSPDEVLRKITARTKAIMAVHTYGLPVDMDPILKASKDRGITVIEDAAEAHGLNYKGSPCGSFGELSTFSFYANKHITTGEGGMILTDNEALAERLKSLRNLCFKKERRFIHEELGFNGRISALQAALGNSQLPRLKKITERKKEIGALYRNILSGSKHIGLPCERTPYAENGYWVFGVVLNEAFGVDSDYIMGELQKKGVGSRPFFYPMHLQPFSKKMGFFLGESYPVSDRLGRLGLYLPCGVGTTDDEVKRAAETLLSVCEEL